jgi:hypothetical protein
MRKLFALILVFLATIANAQNNAINPTTQLWSEADLMGYITPKLKWQADFQYARQSPYEGANLFMFNEQLTIRPWLHYYVNKHFRISTFAGIWYNYGISEVGAREYPEYRSALQFQFYKPIGVQLVVNRFREEFRFIKDRQGAFEFVLRERYMFKYQRLILHKSYDKNALYAIALNEFFINNSSKATGYHAFDQNRIFLGFGYNFTDDIGIETGYFNQFQQHAHDNNFDLNHIWQVSLIIDNITHSKGHKGA